MNLFDPSNPNDLSLLHSSVRDHKELFDVADKVEYEILNHYTEEGEVKLRGYDTEDDVIEAIKRTIATVVSYRLRNYDNQEGVTSIQQGSRSVSYKENPNWEGFPKGWDKYLIDFDERTNLYMA